MKFVKFLPDGSLYEEILPAGHHYVEIGLNEVPIFIRQGKWIPVTDGAEYVEAINSSSWKAVGYAGGEYVLYEDDGISKDYETPKHWTRLNN